MVNSAIKYKKTGIEWMPEMPEHWEVMRLKNICTENLQYGINIPSDQYSDTGIRLLRTTDITEEGEIISDGIFIPKSKVEQNYLIQKGDLLFSRSGTVGRCYLHNSIEEYSFAGFLVRFQPNNHLHSRWIFYFSFTKEFKFQVNSDSLVSTIANFNGNKFANIKFPIPKNENEINQIITYLDTQSEKINLFIQKKKRFIELLKEQRQSIINEAVTKGIDANAKMKNSGIEWLGEVPEHWEVRRCKNVFFELDIRSEDGNEELLSVSHYDGVRKRSEKNVNMFKSEDYTGYKLCWDGDLVINIMWAWMGALGVSNEHGIVSSAYGVYRLKEPKKYDSIYLDFLLRNTGYIVEYTKRSKGVTLSRARMYSDEFFNLFILTPTITEQKQIVIHIKTETKTIDTAIAKTEREIELIKEYKEAMVSEAVMGKIRK